MNPQTIFTYLSCAACFLLTIKLTDATVVDDAGLDRGLDGTAPNLRLLLNNLRNNGLSVLAPPSVYRNKLEPYMHKSPSKRNGFWIWMPASGYVSVPEEEVQGGSSKSSSSNVLRYG